MEKIHAPSAAFREPYQKHSRNISTFSTISDISAVDHIKRDDNAEIKCVFLCDSDHEKNCMFESFNKCLNDGQSTIRNMQLLDFNCHWEQPRNDNGCVVNGTAASVATDCRGYCMPPRTGVGGVGASAPSHLLGML